MQSFSVNPIQLEQEVWHFSHYSFSKLSIYPSVHAHGPGGAAQLITRPLFKLHKVHPFMSELEQKKHAKLHLTHYSFTPSS